MKKTLVAASIAALSTGFVAAPAMADVSGYVMGVLTQPTDSDQDTALTVEAEVVYSHESGAYGGVWFETYDFLEGDDFAEESNIEVFGGYAADLTEEFGYDVGVAYGQPLDNEFDQDYVWIYFGGLYTLDADTSFSAYITYDIDSDVDYTELELRADYTGVEVVDLYAEYLINLQDTDTLNTLELGVGKEIIPQNYVTGAFRLDLEESDNSVIEFTYSYNF
ncbi:protein of unknown function (Gcw_chp) [Marinospirillum celere]|uniref:Outer membrane protein beta-barrel domain-containing protein n=1 Tax=Marinospirillum celere TaxID=1122252 RepID=A0A1I1GPJ3_9GAMM|nr:TorF family putative porin [Marinospirillum celere]SFC13564.1 protein of unknown function (Gcw_chp) [Marinospirillum celere]